MSALNDTMFARPPVYVRREDLPELWRIAAAARKEASGADLFVEEFERLRVAQDAADTQFVRLGACVHYKDLRTKRQRWVRLVRPGEATADDNEVSILSPIGGALIGLAPGSIFRWAGADGRTRAIKVLEIDQAEAL